MSFNWSNVKPRAMLTVKGWPGRSRAPRKRAFSSRVKKALHKVLPQEVYKYDTFSGYVPLLLAGNIDHLTGIAQGTAIDQRDGNRITPKYILFRAVLDNNDPLNAGTQSDFLIMRIILFRDFQQNAAQPTVAQVLQQGTVLSPLNKAYPGRFKILYDRVHVMNATASVGVGAAGAQLLYPAASERVIQVYKKLSKPITWTGAAGNTISNGHIYLLTLTNHNQEGTIIWNVRVGYHDFG